MATKQVTPDFILVMDWETTGADWDKDSHIDYQGIAFGAIVAKADTFEAVDELYCEIKFNDKKWQWTDSAEKIHGLSREHLAEHGMSQEDAAAALLELILKYWGPDGKVMFLGHNPRFDIGFTRQLLNEVGVEFSDKRHADPSAEVLIELHHVVLDSSALGFITTGLFKSDLLFEKMGFEKRGDHNALQDAHMTLGTCATIRALVEAGETVLNG